jgi:hypothetical protein
VNSAVLDATLVSNRGQDQKLGHICGVKYIKFNKKKREFDLYFNVKLTFCFYLEHPFANKVSLQSMHAERLGLTNGETFIGRIHIMKMPSLLDLQKTWLAY